MSQAANLKSKIVFLANMRRKEDNLCGWARTCLQQASFSLWMRCTFFFFFSFLFVFLSFSFSHINPEQFINSYVFSLKCLCIFKQKQVQKRLASLKLSHSRQSLQCHFEEIEMMITERNIDILCISETWLHQELPRNLINIQNVNVYRCDAGRGGVCIYIRGTLKSNNTFITAVNNTAVEEISVTVQSSIYPSFIIGTICRHPYATSE